MLQILGLYLHIKLKHLEIMAKKAKKAKVAKVGAYVVRADMASVNASGAWHHLSINTKYVVESIGHRGIKLKGFLLFVTPQDIRAL